MAKKVIPSLNLSGWEEDSEKILDYLFSYYVLTDYAQSYIFKDKLQCITNIYYKYINDPDKFSTFLKQDFTSYLENYFPIVEVRTTVRNINNDEYVILLSCSVVDEEGKKVDLTKIINLNNISRKVIKVNNYGEGLNYINTI